jgi:membrane-associated protein
VEQITEIIQAFQNFDEYLPLISQFGSWIYIILFAIVFFDTGLFILSFLPSDSLLFTAGALAAFGSLELLWLLLLALVATILADSLNYLIGQRAGRRFLVGRLPFTQPKHMARTNQFFVARGRSAIILARFIPLVRSLTPFVAGMSLMPYRRFLTYNIIGAFLWVSFFALGGYFFGNITLVRENLPLILIAVLLLSGLPGLIELLRGKHITPSQVT